MPKPIHDFAFGIAITALAGSYSYGATKIPTSMLSDSVGAGGLPFELGVFVAGLGVLLAVKSAIIVFAARRPLDDVDDSIAPGAHLKGLALLVIGVAYVLLAPIIGYLFALLALIGSTALLAGARLGWRFFLICLSMAATLTLIFVTVMGTLQPEGWFHSYFPGVGL